MIQNLLPNKAQFDTLNSLLAEIANKSGNGKITDMKTVQKLVRAGLAEQNFSVGDKIKVNRTMEDGSVKELTFDVVDFDRYEPVDTKYSHSMTLMLHDLNFSGIKFCYPDAFYYCQSALQSGTYNVEISGNDYQFTLQNSVPSGGQLVFGSSTAGNPTSMTVESYQSATSTTPIESASITLGSGGTKLIINDISKSKFGSSDYDVSYVRKWLNSVGQSNSFWSADTNFSHKPNLSVNGFLFGLDSDFVSSLGKVKCSLKYPNGTTKVLEDIAFLPSASEMGLQTSSSYDSSEMLEYYKKMMGNSKTDGQNPSRIKYSKEYFGDLARTYCTRTPQNMSFINVVNVNPNGALSVGAGVYDCYFSMLVNIV